MKRRWHLLVAVMIFFCCCVSFAQSRFPSPPPPMAPPPPTKAPTTKVLHYDPVDLQREARELSDLARTVPADIDNVTRGIVSKDLGDRLKRIEKLSKRLRGAISR